MGQGEVRGKLLKILCFPDALNTCRRRLLCGAPHNVNCRASMRINGCETVWVLSGQAVDERGGLDKPG